MRHSLDCVIKDGYRASDVLGRIRGIVRKAPPRKERVDINEAVREVIELTRGEAVRNSVAIQTDIADGLPLIEGDRVQLQQVLLNLIMNALEAMSGVSDGARELLISTRNAEPGTVLVAVRDSGAWPGAGRSGARLHPLLHNQTHRPGDRAVGLPFDHRSARRTIVGERKSVAWRHLSIHSACHE